MFDSKQMLSRYQILDYLGGGGFATVYSAVDRKTGESVALKVLLPQYAENAEFRERFRKEADTARALPDNPHLVKVKDYNAATGTCYLVMELLQGEDLDKVLAQRGALSVNEAADIAMQVADGLYVAHQRRIVHRDIKPSNIKITPTGVKVMDFGIARASEATRLTRMGTIVGTPQYIAPEIWEGKVATPSSDIYSLGVVLYEMLSGHTPFDGDTPAAVMRKHLVEYPTPLEQLRHDTPTQIQWITTRALAKKPGDRYADAGEMLDALQGRSVVEPPRPVVRPTPKRVRAPTPPVGRTNLDSAVEQLEHLARSVGNSLAQPTAAAMLVGRAGDVAGYRFRLAARDTVIGRDRRCLIPLTDRYLSNTHARIARTNGQYYVTDLNSRNGTWLNERLVQRPELLEQGDQLRVGECVFTFYAPRAVMPSRQQASAAKVKDAKLMAAIAHGSIILVPLIAPLAILAAYGRRSRFVEQQTKQALLYQAILSSILLLSILLNFSPFILVWLLMDIGGLYAAWRSYQGVAFEYPVLGELLRTR